MVTNGRGKTLDWEIGDEHDRPFFAMGRDSLDRILASAAEKAGVDFRDGAAVGASRGNGRWRIEIRDHATGGKMSFRAAYLVGADGRNSIVARQLLEPRPGRKAPERIRKDRVGVQWHAASDRRLAGALHMYLFDGGYCGLVDVDGSHLNLAMVTTPELAGRARRISGLPEPDALDECRGRRTIPRPHADRRHHGDVPDRSASQRTTRSECHARRDAYETVEPFTGEGIRMALEDGIGFADRFIAKRRGPERFFFENT